MAGVTIDSGEIEASVYARDVPRDQWAKLVEKRYDFSQVTLTYDCRQVVMFIREADELWRPLGYESADDLIRRGYGLDPEEIRLVSEWLELNDPQEAVKLSDAVKRANEMRADLEKPGVTQADVAAKHGITQGRVSQIISSKTNKQSPTRNARTVYLSSNPATAAERIRAKLGDDFANQLREAL